MTKDTPSPAQDNILNHAHTLLWQRGVKAMSLNDLAKAAHISKGGLLHYFPNKKSVILAVLDRYARTHITKRLDTYIRADDTPSGIKEDLMNWLEDSYKLYAGKDFKEGCLLGNIALETADTDEDLRDTIKAIFLNWENQLVSVLRPLGHNNALATDARQLARLIIALFQGITMTSKVHRDSIRASRDFQALADLIDRMILTDNKA